MRKPSAGGIPAAIAKRLRSIRYAAGDIVFVTGRFLARLGSLLVRVPIAAGRGIKRFWASLSVIARRRLVLALGAAIVVLAFLSLAVPNLPCDFPGGDTCPPADDAADLVPADALAYLHVNLDPETDQAASAGDVLARLPVIGGQISKRALALIPSPATGSLDFERDVRPWFGGEAAMAIVPGAATVPERVDLLEAKDSKGAGQYADALAVGQTQTSEYEGVEVSVDQQHVATAQVQGFLVIGTEDGVRALIATATGADGTESLADDPTATEVRDRLPEHRVAEAWVSPDGVSELIAGATGGLATLTPLTAPGATRGVAASLSADDDGFELAVRSALDPEREKASPNFFAAFPPFEPGLAEKLRPQTLAYLGIGPPKQTVSALLAQASAQAPGIASGFQDLVDALRRSDNVDIEGQLLDALGDQAAFALEPGPDQAGATAATVPPYLLFVADGVDEEEARKGLAALEAPLADAVDTGSDLQAPVFGQQEVSGVETNSLRVSPAVELTYAVFDGLAAIATDPAGVAGLIDDDGGLDEHQLYQRATDGFPDQVSVLAYLDLADLVTIGEQAGLAEDPLYATFAGDIRRLEALGLAVSTDDDVLATDLRLLVSQAEPAGD
ncbi:MAG: hypothetical protein QOI10_2255 [Solirubrobacterales bacterium]|nr:hypothetical protein [Solirubrobacterales bacterium]